MNINETRILNSTTLSSKHAIVSMPKTAWFWLDDLVKSQFPSGGYNALLRAFEKADGATDKPQTTESLSRALRGKAQEHCEAQMAELYNLANDNVPSAPAQDIKLNPSHPDAPDLNSRMPFAYWLFHFLPQATYLTTVWERGNYHLRGYTED